MTDEKKLKHLEFIQNVISRMNSNSFMIKGWCVTLVSALFALAAKDSEIRFAVIAYFIIPMFWILDGFFLATERKYRELYNKVRIKKEEDIDFNMSVEKVDIGDMLTNGVFTKTILIFYSISLIATRVIIYLWG